MPNSIGTKKQREELRRFILSQITAPESRFQSVPKGTTQTALDGLDIAEKTMRACLVIEVLHEVASIDERALTGWVRQWHDAADMALDEALRDWQAWERGSTS